MKLHKIIIPTPFYVGPVNVYLVRNDPVTLIDVGPNTEEAYTALRAGLEEIGLRLDKIERVIITHAHADHYGLAARVQEESGAKIYLHSWEAKKLAARDDYTDHRLLLRRAGVPPEAIKLFEQGYMKIHPLTSDGFEFDTLEDDQEIIFENGSLRVLHTPGHTPGSICLMRESNRELVAADTVIKHITPNPMLDSDPFDNFRRFPSLNEYLCSVSRIKELSPTLIHSGHGHAITDFGEHFNLLIKHTQDRQSRMLSLMPKLGATAWEVSKLLFPNAKGVHSYLAVSEAQAHLDMAVADGRTNIEKREEFEVYYQN